MNSNTHTYAAFIAIDWADQKHVFSLQAAGQDKKETGVLAQKPEDINQWLGTLRERFKGQPLAVALEQSRGALIHALLDHEFLVLYPLHPNTVAQFRGAFKSSGSKNDPLDTDQILAILTKHLDQLLPLKPDTLETRLLGRLVEDRRKAVELRTSHVQALLACLKEYFPQAIELVNGNLCSGLAADFLKRWPTLAAVQQAKPATLRKFYYGHNLRRPELITKAIKLAATAQALTSDAAIVESGSRLSQIHVQIIQALNPIIDDYEGRITTVFDAHPEAKLFVGIPGAGQALAPRLLACFGTDRARYQSAENVQCLSGIAPVTKKSGKSQVVHFRHACPKFMRQTFHEFARLSVAKCQWAKNYVEYYKAKGKSFHAIVRALAFKWIRILFQCWKTRTPYDENKYMDALKKRGSIFATLHLPTPKKC
jgi:transposase